MHITTQKLESSQVGVQRGLLAEDLLKFRWAEEVALDPTGRWLAYTVKQPDAATNGYITHLYLQTLEGGSTQRMTTGHGRASSLAWSRDGEHLAFAWSEAGTASVQIVTPADGQVRHFAPAGAAMTGLDWSSDGSKLVGVRWTPLRQDAAPGPRPGVPAPTIKVVRRLRYKLDGAGWVHDRFAQIWVLDLPSGELTQITDSECDYSEPKWSLHGDRLAFIGLAREQNSALGQGQIFVCDVPHGTPQRLLPDWQGACRSPVWGDDDRHIAFAGYTAPAPVNRRIFMQPCLAEVATGQARLLAPELDQEVGNYAVADQRAGLANITVRWAAGDRWIYFLLTEQGSVSLYRIAPDGTHERIVHGPQVVFEYSPMAGGTTAGGTVAYGMANPAGPGDLYLWAGGETRRVTDLNPWLRDQRLATPEEYWYDGVDGDKVHAWLLKPVDFDPTRRYPLVLYVHCSMFSWDFNLEFQALANAGYIVAYFNQRGTTAGYGQAWTRASEGDQGGQDYQEIMLGVDDLVRRPYIDGARMGVTGGSCGGFMTNWIIGHTDRFAAAVTQRSIGNQISFFGTSDIGPECTLGETADTPWSNLSALWQQSPIAYAADITTPLLILHADEDHRCPLGQAEELFAVLRWLGREVEMVIFEGENHGLTRGGRPGNRIEHMRRVSGWFDKYLR
jgi:dipeptidyl aminopeptidase/acylaminoacyl peptidase